MITQPIIRFRRSASVLHTNYSKSRRKSSSGVIDKKKEFAKYENEGIHKSMSLEAEIFDSPFGLYHEESENDLDIESSKPVGFLGFVECNSESNVLESQSDILIYQFYLLKSVFPDFPEKVLRVLFIRELGNSKFVAKGLVEKGWKPSNLDLISRLKDSETNFIDIPYYWGDLKEEYIKQLKEASPGSYFTVWDSNNFVLYTLNFKKEILRIPIVESPKIQHQQKLLFSLCNPLVRSKSVSILDLYPFIK